MRKIGRIAILTAVLSEMSRVSMEASREYKNFSLKAVSRDTGVSTGSQRQSPKKKQKCIKKQYRPNSQYKSTKPIKAKAVTHYRNKI